MKKIIYSMAMILFVMLLTISVVHAESITNPEQSNSINLPASLQMIDDDAFEGTALSFIQAEITDIQAETANHEEELALVDQDHVEKKQDKETAIDSENRNWSVFLLPGSLKFIEEEAFEGTAPVSVKLPDSLIQLGDRAFANTRNLRSIFIPDQTQIIGKDFLAGTKRVTISGTADGYARTWALEHGVPFAPVATVKADGNGTQITVHTSGKQLKEQLDSNAHKDGFITKQPTRETVGNINASRYENGIAYHVQGRSPPIRL